VEESGTLGEGRRLAAGAQCLIAFLLSAILYILAFPPLDSGETAFVFAAPIILYGLFGRPARWEGLQLFGFGWLVWFILIFWLRHCTSSLDIPLAGLFGIFLTAILSLVLGVFWSSWCWITLKCVRWTKNDPVPYRLLMIIALAALWVVLEWLRGVLFTGFPWLPLSVSQWNRNFVLQIVALTGGAGLSFVLIVFNFGVAYPIYTYWTNRRGSWMSRLSFELYLGMITLVASIGAGIYTANFAQYPRVDGPKLAFVQPNASVQLKWDMDRVTENLKVLEDLSTYASYLGAELILWPESPTLLPMKGDHRMQKWTEELSARLEIPILAGNVAREDELDANGNRWYNAVFTIHPESGVELDDYYRKRRLVPFGEYVPLSQWLPFIDKIVPVEANFGVGKSAEPIRFNPDELDVRKIGNLICYEDIFPALARANTLAGANWHYVATNNAWFGEGAGAWQHAAHSVLRAVETRRPVVRCGNAGWSGWIDEYGNIRHVMMDDTGSIYFQGVDAVKFSRCSYWSGRLSTYVQHGDWFVALSAAVLLAIGLLGYWLKFPRKRHQA
jgi:apolipoprotein N-acyltransferase